MTYEIVIDVKSISVRRRCHTLCREGKVQTHEEEKIGRASSMKTKSQKEERIAQYIRLQKKFMIIVDHDRINNPMIKYQENKPRS
jgi:hypothetical protein